MASPYQSLFESTAKRYGLDPVTLSTFARIESGYNPNVRTGSYRGLFQLSPAQFAKYGGTGNIFDPVANTNAAAVKINALKSQFQRMFGRDPSLTELYMMHQQGPGGAAAHLRNPDQLAWKSMYSTGEGRAKGPAWAKRAIWGNVPTDVRKKYGSVENMTSRDFVDMWRNKVNRFSGGKETVALANALEGAQREDLSAPPLQAPATEAAPAPIVSGWQPSAQPTGQGFQNMMTAAWSDPSVSNDMIDYSSKTPVAKPEPFSLSLSKLLGM